MVISEDARTDLDLTLWRAEDAAKTVSHLPFLDDGLEFVVWCSGDDIEGQSTGVAGKELSGARNKRGVRSPIEDAEGEFFGQAADGLFAGAPSEDGRPDVLEFEDS